MSALSFLIIPISTPSQCTRYDEFAHHRCSSSRRLMDGVRRWMGTNQAQGSRNSRIDRSQDPKSKLKKPHVTPESVPETLPELVMRLLDPIVKEEEEYQEYVTMNSLL